MGGVDVVCVWCVWCVVCGVCAVTHECASVTRECAVVPCLRCGVACPPDTYPMSAAMVGSTKPQQWCHCLTHT